MSNPLFLETLRGHCLARPHQTALEWLDDSPLRLSYGELEQIVQQAMGLLQAHGVQPGDRVALHLPKGLPFVLLHLATLRLGAVSLPLNPACPATELAYFLADAEACLLFASPTTELGQVSAKAIVVDSAQDPLLARLLAPYPAENSAPLPPDATCLMIYTSGTTGQPKGAELTHGNLTANLNSLHAAWEWCAEDLLLHVLPLFHIHGLLVALHGALHAGATTLLLPRFDPQQSLDLLVQRPCSILMGVPTIHRRLVDLPGAERYSLRHLRLVTSGSDRLPEELFARFEQLFGVRLLERYGMSETGMLLSNPLHGERRCGSVGLPLPGVEVRIVDSSTEEPLPDGAVGAVQVRGANVCKGYWRQPAKTAEAFTADGWLRTGDLGLREPDGYITLQGRSKDLIISGGFNVYPPEVERVLASHPAIAASAVFGCPDPEWGERVTAVILLHPGPSLESSAVIDFCRQHLAPYKVPRRVFLATTLPTNAMGKVQKAALRQALCL